MRRQWIAFVIIAAMLLPIPVSAAPAAANDGKVVDETEVLERIEDITAQDSPDQIEPLDSQGLQEEGQPLQEDEEQGEEIEPVSPVPDAPTKVKRNRVGTSVTLSWKQEGEIDGFDVRYADNRLFLKAKKILMEGDPERSCVVEVPKSQHVYLKVRSWRNAPEDPSDPDSPMKKWWSDWSFSKNVSENRSSSVKRLKKSNGKLELRRAAKQKIRGYDTVQGSCYGNGYVYYLLYNRDKNKCKIVKLKLDSRRVVKISPAKKLYHGNDMTYNDKTQEIIVAHAAPDGKSLSRVDPKTLKVKKTCKVNLPKVVPGLTDSKKNMRRLENLGGYAGFSSIAYNELHDQYVAQMYLVRDYMILDSNFTPVRYIRPTAKDGQLYQGIETCGDCIIQCSSFLNDKKYNILSIYDWDGNYLSKIKLNKGMELESAFVVGKKLYVSYYRSYMKTFIKTITVEKRVKVKIKHKKGTKKNKKKKKKYKYVKKKFKKKIRVQKLQRDGYLYRVQRL